MLRIKDRERVTDRDKNMIRDWERVKGRDMDRDRDGDRLKLRDRDMDHLFMYHLSTLMFLI